MPTKSDNEQMVDAVTQTGTHTLADIPAVSMGNLFVSAGQALANSGYGTTMAQSVGGAAFQAATVQEVNTLTATGSSIDGRAIAEMLLKENG